MGAPRCGRCGMVVAENGVCYHCKNDPTCFPKGTKILTPSGDIDISFLKKGDIVLSICNKTFSIKPSKILKVNEFHQSLIWNIEFDDGAVIRTTASHSFKTVKGWQRASAITSEDKIFHIKPGGVKSYRKVKSSCQSADSEKVFNIIVQDNFSFIAEGAVVHSFTYFRKTRTLIWSAVDFFNQNGLQLAID